MILRNAKRRIDSASILLEHALVKGLSTSLKSTYYRSASILLYTVVEGLTYELVRISTTHTQHIIQEKTEHIVKHKIPSGVFSTRNDYCVCEKIKKSLKINDNGITFADLNNYLKNKNIVSIPEYRLLDWIRKERNKLHLQGLNLADTGYTKAKIDKAGEAMDFLITKINALNSTS